MKLITKTKSICPECLKILPATVFERDDKVWIKKECSEHGEVEELYWGSYELYKKASEFQREGKGISNPNVKKKNPICPKDCGLCRLHKTHSGLTNVVVTNRCDLTCWYCFFFAKKSGYVYEPSLDEIRFMVRQVKNEKPIPGNAIQITGGEPLLRDDIIDVIKVIKQEGFDHIQLNTNGIRLSKDPELVKRVREAGVNTLYLSFDGLTPETNPKNHWEIPGVIENCRKAGLGIVLVPTVINSINDHEVADIVKFGFENIDIIRSVNFQPVSLVGRMPKKQREKHRITIPDVIERIEEGTDGEISKEDFYPVPSCMPISNFVEALTGRPKYELSIHFACGMGAYVFKEDGKMLPLTRFVDVEGLFEYLDEKAEELKAGKSKYWVGLKLLYKLRSFIDKDKQPKGFSLAKIMYNILIKHDYSALGKFHDRAMFIGMMHFMDRFNYDIERVKRCDIHYTLPDGRIIPFCAFNVIPEWYRDKTQKEYGMSFKEWKEESGKDLKEDFYKRDKKKLEGSKAYRKVYKNWIAG